jgi:hypothetical protein
MFGCSEVSGSGAGGAGGLGAAGTGGTAGVGGATLTCVEATSRCSNGPIDPIVEDESCQLAEPPPLAQACDGSESFVRPARCSHGTTFTYQLTALEIDDDCNGGYDLDGCDGDSCRRGDQASEEGLNGVDNGLAGLASLVRALGRNLGVINQAYYNALCRGDIDMLFRVDANPEEDCATVTAIVDGEEVAEVAVNLSDDGCLSGSLGNIVFTFGEEPWELSNVRTQFTISEEGFANGQLGATLDQDTLSALAGELIGGGAELLVGTILDIDSALNGDPLTDCNALSLTLKVGGVTIEPPTAP